MLLGYTGLNTLNLIAKSVNSEDALGAQCQPLMYSYLCCRDPPVQNSAR